MSRFYIILMLLASFCLLFLKIIDLQNTEITTLFILEIVFYSIILGVMSSNLFKLRKQKKEN